MEILNDPIIFLYVAIISGVAFVILFVYLLVDTIQKRKKARLEMEEKANRTKNEIVEDAYKLMHNIGGFLMHSTWSEDGSSLHLLAALSRHLHEDFEELCIISDAKMTE